MLLVAVMIRSGVFVMLFALTPPPLLMMPQMLASYVLDVPRNLLPCNQVATGRLVYGGESCRLSSFPWVPAEKAGLRKVPKVTGCLHLVTSSSSSLTTWAGNTSLASDTSAVD